MRLLLLILFLALPLRAANVYVRSMASGAGTGVDWSNAYTFVPSPISRGDTVYIADGTYGGYTFDDATSGTTLITIKKATVADHGTSTGWSDTFGDGIATFVGPWNFTSDYWLIDGVTGSFKSGHGFDLNLTTKCEGIRIQGSNITIRHVSEHWPDRDQLGLIQSAGVEIKKGADPAQAVNTITLENLYLYEVPGYPFRGVNVTSGLVLDHCVVDGMHYDAQQHASILVMRGGSSSGGIVRYCHFEDCEGTGGIVFYDNNTFDGWKIYGNTFLTTTDPKADSFGGGVVAVNDHNLTPNLVVSNLLFYNNTIRGSNGGNYGVNVSGQFATAINCVGRNNIWYDIDFITNFGLSADYNYYSLVSKSSTWNLGAHDTPWNGNTSQITSNPFAGTVDMHLAAALTGYPGEVLAAQYNTDADGVPRGTDGVWDRGAFEFGGMAPPTPTRVLTVDASNGAVGETITVSPNDTNGLGSGTVLFMRTYALNQVVNLAAPATSGGKSFAQWTKNGATHALTAATTVTMDADWTMIAVYTPTAPTGTFFVTSTNLTNPRNNHLGWVGMKIAIGVSDLSVLSLGRIVIPGNTHTHTVKFVTVSNNVTVGSATIPTYGQIPNAFSYVGVTPFTLTANTEYYLVSFEQFGEDQFYNYTTTIGTTTDASWRSAIWADPPGTVWNVPTGGSPNSSYTPVAFTYTVVSPPPPPPDPDTPTGTRFVNLRPPFP